MDTTQKMEEGLQQLSDDKFYKPLGTPIVLDTALKVNLIIVDKLFRSSGNIDTMTCKWLTIGLKQPRIPEFYTLTKSTRKYRSAGQSFLVAAARLWSVFLVSSTHYYNPSQKRES